MSLNGLWSNLIVEELTRNGVNFFCISPGSRSTPLVCAIARHEKAKKQIFYDERAAAFFALGHARATGSPAVLVATSGTAAVNYYPAIVEASMDYIPMIVLTADRPPELRDTGANQTIDQVKLFFNYVRWSFDFPCPTEDISLPFVLTTVDQMVHRSRNKPPGPVHLNLMYREPLIPENSMNNYQSNSKNINKWRDSDRPYTLYKLAAACLTEDQIQDLAPNLLNKKTGVIVVGSISQDQTIKNDLCLLAKKLGWPIFADISSGLNFHGDLSSLVLPFEDLLMQLEKFNSPLLPEVVLHWGGRIVSKVLTDWVSKHEPTYIIFNDWSQRLDPDHKVHFKLEGDLNHSLNLLNNWLDKNKTCIKKPDFHYKFIGIQQEWSSIWRNTAKLVSEKIDQVVEMNDQISEISAVRIINRLLPDDSGLFLSNSMPVRYMNRFKTESNKNIIVGLNRGASGIDGILSSAIGFAQGLEKRVTLIIGDLAFIHDLNSLLLLQASSVSLIVIVMNNQGGNIFSQLPISNELDVLEDYFITPHSLTFQHAAKLFNITYHCTNTVTDLIKQYKTAISQKGSVIIEITIDKEANHHIQNLINQQLNTLG